MQQDKTEHYPSSSKDDAGQQHLPVGRRDTKA